MPFCINCGVELGADVGQCPLCGYAMPAAGAGKPLSAAGAATAVSGGGEERARRTGKLIGMEILSVLFATADSAVLAIDFALNRALTWSLYPAAAVTALWVYVLLMLSVARRPLKTLVISAAALLVLLAGVDFADGVLSWFVPIGLPISLCALACIGLVIAAARRPVRSHALIGVAAAACIALESCVIDYAVARFIGAKPLTWSLIVAACMAPVAVAGLFHHFVLRKHFAVDKYLHF